MSHPDLDHINDLPNVVGSLGAPRVLNQNRSLPEEEQLKGGELEYQQVFRHRDGHIPNKKYVTWRLVSQPGSCYIAHGLTMSFMGHARHDGDRMHATWVHPQGLKRARAVNRRDAQHRKTASRSSLPMPTPSKGEEFGGRNSRDVLVP